MTQSRTSGSTAGRESAAGGSVALPRVSAHWQTDRFDGALYDFVIKRPVLAQIYGAALFGSDFRRFYRAISAGLDPLADGAAVLDVPCGGGVALRALRPDHRLRYVGVDLSPNQLARARRYARGRGLDSVELQSADVARLPFDDGTFDVCLTFMSLHCFAEPGAAMAEMARVLRPWGELRGSVVVNGAVRRANAVNALFDKLGIFGASGTPADLESWLDGAGLVDIRIEQSGAVAYFEGSRGEGQG